MNDEQLEELKKFKGRLEDSKADLLKIISVLERESINARFALRELERIMMGFNSSVERLNKEMEENG